jgi:hypothetical protein
MTMIVRALFAVSVLAALLGTTPAGAATAPKLRVDPAAGIVDLQHVQVAGTGFRPGSTVSLTVCLAGATAPEECTGDAFMLPVDAAGRFSDDLAVRRFFTTPAGDVDCADAPGTCELLAFVPGRWSTVLARTPLAFDPDAPPAPPLETSWTIDAFGTVDEAGVATVSGSVRCSRAVDASVHLYLQQAATGVRQAWLGPLSCATVRMPWSVKVRVRHSSVRFEPGPAHVNLYGYGFDYYGVHEDHVLADITLRPED